MTLLTGQHIIGGGYSASGPGRFYAINPSNGEILPGEFAVATKEELDLAVSKAVEAFNQYKQLSGNERADFLDAIAIEIEALGDDLIERCTAETGLPVARLQGERGRTTSQLRLFASLLREGSWVQAKIENALPDRTPLPRVDIRSMFRPLGPVAVFGASNFPLAFSVAGGDTASALAAGCTVVVKGHPGHPGTSELVGRAIQNAVKKCGLNEGVFSLLQENGFQTGVALVEHPGIKAVGFTGSYKGGMALFNIAVNRPEPIPFYAEMGSTNPVFVLPGARKTQAKSIAAGYAGSVTMGAGQFCTNPGLLITAANEDITDFEQYIKEEFEKTTGATMLTPGIKSAFDKGVVALQQHGLAELIAKGVSSGTATSAEPALFKATTAALISEKILSEEVFGPSSVLVTAQDKASLYEVANSLSGHLTATIHGTAEDLEEYRELIAILENKAGRVLINGFPTGVEVCHSMVHGGPFPSTSDSRTTSVGTGAIERFVRPVCFQNYPQSLLPAELKDENPLGINRLVDGKWGFQ